MGFDWKFGVEEEYFLVDRRTGAACSSPPQAFWAELKISAPSACKELLQSQVEAKTLPCRSAKQCLEELQINRAAIDAVANNHGLGLMACGTHPDFDWREGKESEGRRYSKLARDMRILALRNLYCGLHVHAETPEGLSRVALMNRCAPFLPMFLALSVSSPFWRGEWTGMHGYRLTGYDELPRTGLPPVFRDTEEHFQYIETLRAIGAIRDASFVWWAIRPSLRFPTLEMRICDSVTDVRAAVAIATLYRCLVHRLASDADFGPTPSPALRAIAEENRWQVQCDGLDATMADVETLKPIGVRDAIEQLACRLQDDANRLGCAEELDAIRGLLSTDTSAVRQIELWKAAPTAAEGLNAVKAWLLDATLA